MAKEVFTARFNAEIKERLEAEARSEGLSAGAHAEAIIANHLAGRSLEQLVTVTAELKDEVESQRRSHEAAVGKLRAAQDLQTKAILFAMETVIFNLPNGGERAVELFRTRYFEELQKGG